MSVRMIKPGKDNDPKLLFICNCCGAVLEAGIGDYSWTDAGARGIAAVCTCPNCGDDCYRYDLKRLLKEKKAETDKRVDKNEAQNHDCKTRAEILDAAKKIVTGEREKQYGKPEDNFAVISEFWTTYTGHPISPEDVATMMALLKIARIRSGNYKADSFIDGVGYLSIGGEISARNMAAR